VPKLDRALVAGVSGRCEPVVSLALSMTGGAGGGVVPVRDVWPGCRRVAAILGRHFSARSAVAATTDMVPETGRYAPAEER
jgi:uncharacterized membrane protein YeiH